MLPNALARPVEAVGADDAHGDEVIGRAEAARGEVALCARSAFERFRVGTMGMGEERGAGTDFVLDGLVAASWGEVLSHGVSRDGSGGLRTM